MKQAVYYYTIVNLFSYIITEDQCTNRLDHTSSTYVQKSGHIKGESMETKRATSTSQCSDRCSNNPDCCVFQYSKSERMCELYKECANSDVHLSCPKPPDYIFCQKSKYFFNIC